MHRRFDLQLPPIIDFSETRKMDKSGYERHVRIGLRATNAQIDLIDCATKTLGETRSHFILDASVDRATTVLLDRTRFVVDDDMMARFLAALEAPLPNPEALRQLMARSPGWEKPDSANSMLDNLFECPDQF